MEDVTPLAARENAGEWGRFWSFLTPPEYLPDSRIHHKTLLIPDL